MSENLKKIVIIGGGPAGLMAAQRLSVKAGFDVHLFEQKASVGRKFLIAGRGGLNLTHSESIQQFVLRYGPAEAFMAPHLTEFTPTDLRAWATDLGIETFVGSSGRVFPKEMKSTGLMRAWTKRLTNQGVTFHLRHRLTGFDEKGFLFLDKNESQVSVQADAVLFAMGGASYPHLGSTGEWVPLLSKQGLDVTDLKPVNCGFDVAWSDFILEKHEGRPIKNIALSFKGESARGDLILSRYGLEGGAIYALSRSLSAAFDQDLPVQMRLDLRPDLPLALIADKLSIPRKKQSLSSFLRKRLHFSPLEVSLLREFTEKDAAQTPQALAANIKNLSIPLIAPRPIDRAISSAGGLEKSMLDKTLMLQNHPGWFAAGEMINWDAATGGYLLQGCFSMGVTAAKGIENWLNAPAD